MSIISQAGTVWIYIRKTPARTLRGWLLASLILNVAGGWLVYQMVNEAKLKDRQIMETMNKVYADKRDAELEIKRLRKKVEKP